MIDSNDKPNTLRAFFSRPEVGIAGSIASIVGILLSVYFFQMSVEKPELTYVVHPIKTAVVRTGQISRLSVRFDGKNLTDDVTAAQIAFWNSGRRPIRSGAILSPLVIRTGTNARILEARLEKASRDVVGLTVNSSRLSSGEVEIRWSILEQNDGGVLQIIYAGDEEVDIRAHAILEGQPEVVRLRNPREISKPGKENPPRQSWIDQVPSYVLIVFGFVIWTMSGLLYLLKRERQPKLGLFEWMMLPPGPLLVVAGILLLYLEHAAVPPFGF